MQASRSCGMVSVGLPLDADATPMATMATTTRHKPEWWHRVFDEIRAYQAAHAANLPGAAFGVETEADGRLVDCIGQGWREDTICEIGSMTKPFVSAALLLALEERHELDVELPVCDLPGMDAYAGD